MKKKKKVQEITKVKEEIKSSINCQKKRRVGFKKK
jgi:hypothetical protein